MLLLTFSLLGLGLGPLLDRFAHGKHTLVAFLEGFVAATILGLVLGHILPEALAVSGWKCLPAALLGLLGPQLAEGWFRNSETRIHSTVSILALAGLFFHALTDGAALSGAQHVHLSGTALALGVVFHRLPVGLTIWWLVRKNAGTRPALLALTGVGVGTLLGYIAGDQAIFYLNTLTVALFQAFVGCGLIHVVLHQRLTDTLSLDTPAPRLGPFRWGGIGACIGLGLLWFMPISASNPAPHPNMTDLFVHYWTWSAPLFLVGYLVWGGLKTRAFWHLFTWGFGTAVDRTALWILSGILIAACTANLNILPTLPPQPLWRQAAGLLLALLIVLSLLRQGPNGLVHQIGHTHNHHSH